MVLVTIYIPIGVTMITPCLKLSAKSASQYFNYILEEYGNGDVTNAIYKYIAETVILCY